jgi:hypothetical protein
MPGFLRLSGWELSGRVHQTEFLPILLHGLGEFGMLLLLLGFKLPLGVVAVGNVLHQG